MALEGVAVAAMAAVEGVGVIRRQEQEIQQRKGNVRKKIPWVPLQGSMVYPPYRKEGPERERWLSLKREK